MKTYQIIAKFNVVRSPENSQLIVGNIVNISLVTRPGFSFKEPRRAASAGLVRKVKIYHISGELRDLDGFGGARWRNNSISQ